MNPLQKSLKQLIGGPLSTQKALLLLKNHPTLPLLLQANISLLRYEAKLTELQATRLQAGLSLLKLPLQPVSFQYLSSPQQVASVFADLSLLEHEQLWMVTVNRKKRVLRQQLLTQGVSDMTIVDPRQIYRMALVQNASAIVLIHNHPSGDPTPSKQDINITKRIAEIGTLLRIPLLDHVIIAQSGYASLAELGHLPPKPYHQGSSSPLACQNDPV
ncbi:MAG: hypothetical protein CMK59_03250 [Proteobacteria bacterium]|nr:hypothetical protein [Pseudomonadota bacterium]